jgi:subtilase family serine protease
MRKIVFALSAAVFTLSALFPAHAQRPVDILQARPPIRVRGTAQLSPTGLTPKQIRAVYKLPATGGSGTIAIIDAFDYLTAEKDLKVFSDTFGLPACTTANGCFEKRNIGRPRTDSGWALEAALDIQWAHAIAPNAKILLVQAQTNSFIDLLNAVDYARNRADVVAISMSWGGSEFDGEQEYDSYFTSQYGATFFAASGDWGTGVIWPSSSPNIVSVGGTTLNLKSDGSLDSETAWYGSGGGVSLFESTPAYQTTYGVKNTGGKRAGPDVSYDADPISGFSVYTSTGYYGQRGWLTVGGTSAGSPQWAAIRALGGSNVKHAKIYADAASTGKANYFRDIVSGTNGSCALFCTAGTGYDYVTGVGSPLTTSF